jgi:hypothetical protein
MKKVNLFPFLTLLILAALAACNLPAGGAVTVSPPTSAPSTATQQGGAATQQGGAATQQGGATTVPPTATVSAATPIATAGAPTAAPSPTTAPAATSTLPPAVENAPEAIAILAPGPGSRVVSPVRVTGSANPTFEQSLVVTILLANGTELVTTNTQIAADVGQRGAFSVDVPFSVAAEQPGFIQVYALSPKDGGVTHLSSTVVTLAPSGSADIRPAAPAPEQIQILSPLNGAEVSGGVVRVQGFGLASFEQTLLVELLDENGAVLATTPVMVNASDLGQPGSFSAELAYTASAAVSARLQVRDISPAHGGNTHLSSVEITLKP